MSYNALETITHQQRYHEKKKKEAQKKVCSIMKKTKKGNIKPLKIDSRYCLKKKRMWLKINIRIPPKKTKQKIKKYRKKFRQNV